MPVISFTPGDALQTVVVEAGIYLAEIIKIDGPKPSSSGKSVSYFTDFRITSPPKYKGKELTIVLNSETNSVSQLGSMQFFPQSMFLAIDAAINNKKIEAVDQALDTDNLLHKPLDIVVGVVTVEGRLINCINNFMPAGSGQSVTPF